MKDEITLEDIRRTAAYLKAHCQPPRIIETQQEADDLNKRDHYLGLSYKWRVGDAYYLIEGFIC